MYVCMYVYMYVSQSFPSALSLRPAEPTARGSIKVSVTVAHRVHQSICAANYTAIALIPESDRQPVDRTT